ncbi:hypothetical protein CHS0354_024169 [Potamilus streckersoni]|uniref:Succinate dehydrogenase [ubiquinone] iron-sulfur subunit, mitochondrial n=1 Tax=Potamilus streckersoni TaxID=2493646 RepID=A0AAE0VMY6_9BIVA|nr:hypothetical protein CHS0354_024169 [Potamilus streckersoni]
MSVTLIVLFSTCLKETLANESEYLIVWWNVENLFDTVNDPRKNDDEYTPTGKREWTEQRLNKKFENLAHVIKDISKRNKKQFPDIMGFCEVENEPLLDQLYKKYIKAANHKIVYHESMDSRGIDVSFVYNSKTFRLINKKVIGVKIYDKPTRDILLGHFKDLKKGYDLYVFLNHWPSRIGGEEKTELKRISAAKSLRHAIDSLLKKNADADILLMGDFNDEPIDKSILTYLKSSGSRDYVKKGTKDIKPMKLEVTIKRFNPEVDSAKGIEKTYITEADPHERVLDVLNKIKWEQDGTLSYRKSCAHGVCGSDAMMINGENKLACVTLVKDIKSDKLFIEPLPGASVIKDLIVDMDPFWNKYKTVLPYLITDEPTPENERYQHPDDHLLIEESTKCILCGACSFSCPSTWSDSEYLGPAALLKAYRFIFDSRDQAADQRLKIIDNNKGLWKCYTIFNCVQACPKEIDITKHISALKRRVVEEQF